MFQVLGYSSIGQLETPDKEFYIYKLEYSKAFGLPILKFFKYIKIKLILNISQYGDNKPNYL
jgi:hypothetical protein